jgi:hypothetical protein
MQAWLGLQPNKKTRSFDRAFWSLCGGRGIRTPGTLRYNGFQDRRIRPLCHSSGREINKILGFCLKIGLTLMDVSIDGLFRRFGRKASMSAPYVWFFGGLLFGLCLKTQYLYTFQRFFLGVFLSGFEKKLYLYRIWLESLKTFTNP